MAKAQKHAHTHIKALRDAHEKMGQTIDQLEQIMAAKQAGDQEQQQEPAQPSGVSPLGGQAQ